MNVNSNTINIRAGLGRLFVLIGITLYAVGQTVGAQTRFTLPDTAPDLSKYETAEDCASGLGRILNRENVTLPYWVDTVELVGGEEFEALPAVAKDFSFRCIAKFNPDSADLDMYYLWIRVYLAAGNDNAAQSIASRKLAATLWETQDSSLLFENILDKILTEYSNARPYRIELVRSLLDTYLEGEKRPTGLAHLVNLYSSKVHYELSVGDSTTAKVWAQKVLDLIDTSARSQQNADFFRLKAASAIAAAREVVESKALLDSLRVSGEAYAALRRFFWKEVTSGDANDYVKMIGEKAKPLVGEFVYSRDGSPINTSSFPTESTSSPVGVFPTLGKVSMVVFLYGGCRAESPNDGPQVRRAFSDREACLDSYTVLHRLAKKYPDVEITIVSRTLGYVGDLGPLSPAEEAEKLRWWWLESHKLPASLVISETAYFNLPGLDRRRIDNADENATNYTYLSGQRRAGDISNKTIYLIDSDGAILAGETLNVRSEKLLRPILDIITNRNK